MNSEPQNKKDLSERDICTKYITPALQQAGWTHTQFREEVKLTNGRVHVRGKMALRVQHPDAKGGPRRADYVLYAKPNVPLAVLEAKRNIFSVSNGMQQALAYAEMLDAPFAISTNGDGFLLHDRTGITQPCEQEVPLHEFPTYEGLWQLYLQWKGLSKPEQIDLIAQPYHSDGSEKEPYYYQPATPPGLRGAPPITFTPSTCTMTHTMPAEKPRRWLCLAMAVSFSVHRMRTADITSSGFRRAVCRVTHLCQPITTLATTRGSNEKKTDVIQGSRQRTAPEGR